MEEILDPAFRSIWQKEKYFGRKFGSTYLYLRGSDSIFNLLEVFLAGSNLIGIQEPLKDFKKHFLAVTSNLNFLTRILMFLTLECQ